MNITARLAELGIILPQPPAPVAAYVPHVLAGSLLFISGQVPVRDGAMAYVGKLGVDLDIAQGQEAARLCAINILAQAQAALGGDLARVVRVVKLGGFVACAPGFTDHPKVINGASALMQEVFGEAGQHTRFAVGAPSLPGNAAVEVEAILAVK